MKKNMGSTDTIIRLVIVVILAVLYFTNVITGVWTIVLLIPGVILLVTSAISFCPLYALFGISTCAIKK